MNSIEQWKKNIRDNYNNDKNTNIKSQLLDMSHALGLHWTWSDVEYGYSTWKPKTMYEISKTELKNMIKEIENHYHKRFNQYNISVPDRKHLFGQFSADNFWGTKPVYPLPEGFHGTPERSASLTGKLMSLIKEKQGVYNWKVTIAHRGRDEKEIIRFVDHNEAMLFIKKYRGGEYEI